MNTKCKVSILLIFVLITILMPLAVALTPKKYGGSGALTDSTLRLIRDYNRRGEWAINQYNEDNPRVRAAAAQSKPRVAALTNQEPLHSNRHAG